MKNYEKAHWTIDSWGSDYAPANADEIISKANDLIDQYIAENPDCDEADVQEYANDLWEAFCGSGELDGIVAETADNSAYQSELRSQRDAIIAEDTNPSRAWMIQEAYSITRNPYRRKGRR